MLDSLTSRFYWKNLDLCLLLAERRLEVVALASSSCAKLNAGSSETREESREAVGHGQHPLPPSA